MEEQEILEYFLEAEEVGRTVNADEVIEVLRIVVQRLLRRGAK